MGVPSVIPASVPERMETRSFSARGVVSRLWPGRRRVSCGWMSDSVRARHGGQPSTIAPTPLQCDSPKVETRKMVPKVDMRGDAAGAGWGRM
eukprot:scaffold158378_cov27-Tisochrysis_lutea.AAC.1